VWGKKAKHADDLYKLVESPPKDFQFSKSQLSRLKKKIRVHKELQIKIVSGSMWPILEVNEFAMIRPILNPEIGDILVFWNGKILIAHRLKAIQKNLLTEEVEYITAPANPKFGEDLPIGFDSILGVVTKVRYSRIIYWKYFIYRKAKIFFKGP
jgi:hypothetical protein